MKPIGLNAEQKRIRTIRIKSEFEFCRYSSNHFLALYNQQAARNEFLCEKCGQAFMTTSELIEHSDELHIKKRKPSELTTDTNSSRPYLCDICGKGYTQSSHLYQHLRFHKGNERLHIPLTLGNRRNFYSFFFL